MPLTNRSNGVELIAATTPDSEMDTTPRAVSDSRPEWHDCVSPRELR